jgi:hypothetical protein
VKKCLSVTESNQESEKQAHLEKKEAFMLKIGQSMDILAAAFQRTLEEQNDLKFMRMLDENSKKRLAEEMYRTKMARHQAERRTYKKRMSATTGISVHSGITVEEIEIPDSTSNSDNGKELE